MEDENDNIDDDNSEAFAIDWDDLRRFMGRVLADDEEDDDDCNSNPFEFAQREVAAMGADGGGCCRGHKESVVSSLFRASSSTLSPASSWRL